MEKGKNVNKKSRFNDDFWQEYRTLVVKRGVPLDKVSRKSGDTIRISSVMKILIPKTMGIVSPDLCKRSTKVSIIS